jgi:hypothetical protein
MTVKPEISSLRLHQFSMLIFAIASVGCAVSVPAPMLPVADFGVLQQSELVTLQTPDQEISFTARLEGDGRILNVVALTPTGQRLFSFRRQGNRLHAEPGPMWPKAMPLKAVWADIEMAHAPARPSLSPHWEVIRENNGAIWMYDGSEQARVINSESKIHLIRARYTLTLEVLPE